MIDTKTVTASNLTEPSALRTIDTDASSSIKEFEGVNFKPEYGTKLKNPVKLFPFLLMHIACLGVLFVDFSVSAVLLCIVLYAVRMFALTAGYHRYFSHRSYKTSRPFQFILGLLGTLAVQKGPLWWAAHHRRHHKYSDQEGDVHSPVQEGFWWSHIGWIVSPRFDPTDWDAIKDFSRYRELCLLNTWHLIPPVLMAVSLFLVGGWQWLVWGFFVSTVALYHGTFSVNSLSHVWGSRRFATNDQSRNNFLIALWTGGEGWHNNHHHYMASVRQGFYWWEVDCSYYILRMMSWVRLVSDLRVPPKHLLTAARLS
ncbi:MAG TPA: acyl-CoA desaturase [Blastocatellia bacterium]|nr:acyl-CoA desaturase [Blastocatellia bacterium]